MQPGWMASIKSTTAKLLLMLLSWEAAKGPALAEQKTMGSFIFSGGEEYVDSSWVSSPREVH